MLLGLGYLRGGGVSEFVSLRGERLGLALARNANAAQLIDDLMQLTSLGLGPGNAKKKRK